MRRWILVLSFLLPALSFADQCRFSNRETEYMSNGPGNEPSVYSETLNVTADHCAQKMCLHVIVCGAKKEPKMIACAPVNGECRGYTADKCLADSLARDAAYQQQ